MDSFLQNNVTNRHIFTSSFWTWMPFISFSCLITLARTSRTILKRRGERNHPCLVPDLMGKTFVFHRWIWHYVCFFSQILFIMLRKYPSISSFLSHFLVCFYCKRVLDFMKYFLCISGDHHVGCFPFILSIMWYIALDDFLMFNQPPLHS